MYWGAILHLLTEKDVMTILKNKSANFVFETRPFATSFESEKVEERQGGEGMGGGSVSSSGLFSPITRKSGPLTFSQIGPTQFYSLAFVVIFHQRKLKVLTHYCTGSETDKRVEVPNGKMRNREKSFFQDPTIPEYYAGGGRGPRPGLAARLQRIATWRSHKTNFEDDEVDDNSSNDESSESSSDSDIDEDEDVGEDEEDNVDGHVKKVKENKNSKKSIKSYLPSLTSFSTKALSIKNFKKGTSNFIAGNLSLSFSPIRKIILPSLHSIQAAQLNPGKRICNFDDVEVKIPGCHGNSIVLFEFSNGE